MGRKITSLILLLVFVFATVCLVAAQDNMDQLADQASVAYNNRDFETAVVLYTKIINLGAQSGELYFNLGNSYYQLNDFGRALVNYRRAELFIPRDEDLKLNILRVQVAKGDGLPDNISFTWLFIDSTRSSLTQGEHQSLLILLWYITCFLGSLYIVLPHFRRKLNWGGAVIILLITVGLIFGLRMYVERQHPLAVVISDNVPAMSGPGDNYMEIYALHAASEIRVIEMRDEWVRFQLSDLREGWIHRMNLEIV